MRYAKIAAKWWADQLRKAVRNPEGYFGFVLNSWLARDTQPIEKRIKNFEQSLERAISAEFQEYGYVDLKIHSYGPCYILGKAAREAGIPSIAFKTKDAMLIKADEGIIVKSYGEPIQTIA